MSTDNLKDLTDCSVCYSPLFEPKILPCGHTFCFDCVKKLYQNDEVDSFECPECRTVHEIPHHRIPTDFKLKQVVEMMHRLGKNQPFSGQWQNKICSCCADSGDIKNYFVCETCFDGEFHQLYCARCIVKKHQTHSVREALDEAKDSICSAMDKNLEIVGRIKENVDFFRQRYEIQNHQLFHIFKMLAGLCEQVKKLAKEDFNHEYVRLSETTGQILEKMGSNIYEIFNESDNCIYRLCMSILTDLESDFNIPQAAMEALKTNIMKGESLDLYDFLSNMQKDELPTLDQGGASSSGTATTINVSVSSDLPGMPVDPSRTISLGTVSPVPSEGQRSSRNNMGYGKNKLYQAKRRR